MQTNSNTDSAMIRMFDLRKRLGVSDETIRRWRKNNKLPPPDINQGGSSVWWHLETLERAGFRFSGSADQAAANQPTPA